MDPTSTPPGSTGGPQQDPGQAPGQQPPRPEDAGFTSGPTGPGTQPGPSGPGGTSGPGGLTSFFDSLRRSGLVRPDESARSGPGVCTAVANRVGVDVTLVRVVVVVLTVFGGFGLLAYGIAWLFVPQPDGRIHAEEILRGRVTAGGVGSLIAIFFGFGGFGRWWWAPGEGGNWGALIALVTIVGVGALIWWALAHQNGRDPDAVGTAGPTSAASVATPTSTRVDLDKGHERVDLLKDAGAPPRREPLAPVPVTPPPPRRDPAGPAVVTLVAGLALVAAAALLLVDRVQPLPVHVPLVASVAALALVGLSVVIVGLAGRRAGGLTGLAVLAACLMVVGWGDARADGVLSDWRSADESARFDDGQWAPSGQVTDDRSYAVEFGSGTLDLTDVDPLDAGDDPATLSADVRFGSLTVLVPDDLTVDLDLSTSEGRVAAPGEDRGGRGDISTTIGPDGPVDVRIEGSSRLGELVVQEVSR